jgi:hypothetical protein
VFVANSLDQNEFLYHNNANGIFTPWTPKRTNIRCVTTGQRWSNPTRLDNRCDGSTDGLVLKAREWTQRRRH